MGWRQGLVRHVRTARWAASLAFLAVAGTLAVPAAASAATTAPTGRVRLAVTISTGSRLPDAVLGKAFSTTLKAASVKPPVKWSLYAGKLPTGLKLSASGVLAGKPTEVATFSFKVKIADAAKHTAIKALTLSVYRVLVVTSASLPTAKSGSAYSVKLAAAGRRSPYTWKVTAGALPGGLKLSASGTISGTPAEVGHAQFTVTATDSAKPSEKASKVLTLAVTSDTLPAGGTLHVYDYLVSSGGQYTLVMQSDGNLVEYFGSEALWSSGTSGTGNYAIMQTDGNLVVYGSSGTVLWASNTGGHSPGSYALVIQWDANVVVYGPSGPVWASSTAQPGVLPANGTLLAGWLLTSPGGQYTLDMQSDGNLVEYFDGDALWSSGTGGNSGDHAVLQSDGNLVILSKSGTVLWSSGTGAHPAAAFSLALQADANLVIYGPSGAVWASSTQPPDSLAAGQNLGAGWTLRSPDGRFVLVMQQTDGNLVIYGPNGAAWASNTSGSGNYLAMQTDGNLVIYQPGGHPVWAANTGGSGNTLVMQSDGNLVVYQPGGHPVWASNTPPSSGSGGLTTGQWAGTSGPQAASQYYGYPYPNAPQCTAGAQVCVLDQWKFYQGQCTSWVAYRLNQLNGIAFGDYYGGQHWGDASDWASAARALNITVNGTPAVGSVAWYSADHVAYVEKVNSPTSIVISEMNYDYGNGFWVHTVTAGAKGWPTDFIHIADR